MRKIQGMKLSMLFGLMAVAVLVFAIPPNHVWAQDVDVDNDGFTDSQESTGITLFDQSIFPSCIGTGYERAYCFDPASKDLFVIVVPATSSLIPMNPLEFVSRNQTSGGLGIATHEIDSTEAGPDREITSTQRAVRITESLDTGNTVILGISQYGTPNGLDLATVYTKRIENHIKSVCGSSFGTSKCADNTGVSGQPLIDKYIKHTIAHEAAHMLTLTTTYNDRFGGHHYKTGTKVILDQSVYYKGTTFYIGTTFTSADQSGATLK